MKCKNCKLKDIKYNKKYCSTECWYKSIEFKNLIYKSGIKSAEKNRINKTGFYGMTHGQHVAAGIISSKFQEKNKTGFYGMTNKEHINAGKKSYKTHKKNKTGFYSISKEDRIKNGKIGGNKTTLLYGGWANITDIVRKNTAIKSIKTNRNNKQIKLNGLYFDSNYEKEIALCLLKQYLINKLVYRKNVHIKIGSKEYDFYIDDYNTFLEPHADYWTHGEESYYKQRRKNLNRNGYNDYNLVVIK